MDKVIFRDAEEIRLEDLLWLSNDAQKGLGYAIEALLGSATTVVHGFEATAQATPNLTINVALGQIYKRDKLDAQPFADLPADSTLIMQQGYADDQILTFDVSDLATGKSKYALVEVTFQQPDAIRIGDPDAGIANFWNSADPTHPLYGNDGNGSALPTVRQGIAFVKILYGAIADTSSAVAPSVEGGFAPLYLIKLTHNDTQIPQDHIVTHDDAPFLGGLLEHDHSGAPGHGVPIDINDTIGTLDISRLPFGGGVISLIYGTGNPNGNQAGALFTEFFDDGSDSVYLCTTAGDAAHAVWTQIGGSGGGSSSDTAIYYNTFPHTITETDGALVFDTSAGAGDVYLPDATQRRHLRVKVIGTSGNELRVHTKAASGQLIDQADQLITQYQGNAALDLYTLTISGVPGWERM